MRLKVFNLAIARPRFSTTVALVLCICGFLATTLLSAYWLLSTQRTIVERDLPFGERAERLERAAVALDLAVLLALQAGPSAEDAPDPEEYAGVLRQVAAELSEFELANQLEAVDAALGRLSANKLRSQVPPLLSEFRAELRVVTDVAISIRTASDQAYVWAVYRNGRALNVLAALSLVFASIGIAVWWFGKRARNGDWNGIRAWQDDKLADLQEQLTLLGRLADEAAVGTKILPKLPSEESDNEFAKLATQLTALAQDVARLERDLINSGATAGAEELAAALHDLVKEIALCRRAIRSNRGESGTSDKIQQLIELAADIGSKLPTVDYEFKQTG